MKIKKIELRNFRGTPHAVFELGHLNSIIGPNGKGKSTLIEAIKTGINGKVPNAHIMVGAPSAELALEIEAVGEIVRTWYPDKPTKATLNGKRTTQSSIMDTIQKVYGISSQTASVMSSSEVLERMFGESFAEYVLQFITNDMDLDKLVALSGLSPDAEKELRMYLPEAPEPISLEMVADAYTYYKDGRRDVKNAYDTKLKQSQYSGPIPGMKAQDYAIQMKDLSEAIGRTKANATKYAELKVAKERAVALVNSLEAALKPIQGVTLPTTREVEATEQALSLAKKSMMDNWAAAENYKRTVLSLQKILAGLNTPVCPISGKLVCTTDKTTVKKEIEAEIAGLVAEGEKAKAQADSMAKEVTALEEKVAGFAWRKQAYAHKIETAKQLAHAKASAEKIVIPVAPDPNALTELTKAYELLSEGYRSATAYETAKKAETEAVHLGKTVQVFEELVELLSPKGGARKKILEHNLSPLEAYCNAKMGRVIPHLRMRFDLCNGAKVLLVDAAGNTLPLEALSTGEKMRTMFVVVDMLNALNGFNILLMDNIDGIDSRSLEEVLKLILEEKDNYDHILLCGIDHRETVNLLAKYGFKELAPTS